MDQLLHLGNLHQQTAPASTDADSHQPHPLVTFGRGDKEVEEKQKPRIKPSQIYQNYKKVKKSKSLKHAASKGSA
jgi:hypothetical protein